MTLTGFIRYLWLIQQICSSLVNSQFFILTTGPDESKRTDRKRNEQRPPIKKMKKLKGFFVAVIDIQTVAFTIFVLTVFFPCRKSRSKR